MVLGEEYAIPIVDALEQFRTWYKKTPHRFSNIWCAGADLEWLGAAYRLHDPEAGVPWAFYQPRCVRTIRDIGDSKFSKLTEESADAANLSKILTTHHPLDDCKRQVVEVCMGYQRTKKKRGTIVTLTPTTITKQVGNLVVIVIIAIFNMYYAGGDLLATLLFGMIICGLFQVLQRR